MNKDSVTLATRGFRVEDVTFKHARKQEEILKEMGVVQDQEEEVVAPVSITPEQVKQFCKDCILVAKDTQTKRVYSQMIKWINELSDTKKKLIAYELKEQIQRAGEDSPEDIQE